MNLLYSISPVATRLLRVEVVSWPSPTTVVRVGRGVWLTCGQGRTAVPLPAPRAGAAVGLTKRKGDGEALENGRQVVVTLSTGICWMASLAGAALARG